MVLAQFAFSAATQTGMDVVHRIMNVHPANQSTRITEVGRELSDILVKVSRASRP